MTNITNHQKGVSTFRGIAIILIEAIVVFFVFYFLYFFWIENPMPTSNILIIRAFNRSSVISIPDQVDTNGWLSFTNSDYNFSFLYPADYTVTRDDIKYGDYDGEMFNLSQADNEVFSLRVFEIVDEETIEDALQRLTGIKPSIYQSFSEQVDDYQATVYRVRPKTEISDQIYFIANNYLFVAEFSEFSARILATFQIDNH